jgi:hypothetical protein
MRFYYLLIISHIIIVDDGTGVISCKVFKDEVNDSICEKLDFGDCCIIEGEIISDYSSTYPVINVYRIGMYIYYLKTFNLHLLILLTLFSC